MQRGEGRLKIAEILRTKWMAPIPQPQTTGIVRYRLLFSCRIRISGFLTVRVSLRLGLVFWSGIVNITRL